MRVRITYIINNGVATEQLEAPIIMVSVTPPRITKVVLYDADNKIIEMKIYTRCEKVHYLERPSGEYPNTIA